MFPVTGAMETRKWGEMSSVSRKFEMNNHPTISEASLEWANDFDLDLRDFDEWMTRQLNCLVGRNLKFATPQQIKSQNRNSKNSLKRG